MQVLDEGFEDELLTWILTQTVDCDDILGNGLGGHCDHTDQRTDVVLLSHELTVGKIGQLIQRNCACLSAAWSAKFSRLDLAGLAYTPIKRLLDSFSNARCLAEMMLACHFAFRL